MTRAAVCETHNRPYLIARNHATKEAVFFRPRCKSWRCPACSKVNKALWAIRAYEGSKAIMECEKPLFFMTVTSHEKLTADQSLWVWPSAWGQLRDRMKYRAGGVFFYIMVPEHHLDGRLHVHAIESAGVGQSWLKSAARESGLGYMDEEKPIKTPQGSAWYVSKYLGKSIEKTDWPKGFRRVRASRNWPKLPEQPMPEGWQFAPLPKGEALQAEVDRYEIAGYRVEVLNHISAWDFILTENYEGEVPLID
jgi:hypothetical protein